MFYALQGVFVRLYADPPPSFEILNYHITMAMRRGRFSLVMSFAVHDTNNIVASGERRGGGEVPDLPQGVKLQHLAPQPSHQSQEPTQNMTYYMSKNWLDFIYSKLLGIRLLGHTVYKE